MWLKRKSDFRYEKENIYINKKGPWKSRSLISRGRGDRTPVNGFGDRRTTTVLFLYFGIHYQSPKLIIAWVGVRMQVFFAIYYFFWYIFDILWYQGQKVKKSKSHSYLHDKTFELGIRQTWESSNLSSKSADFECLRIVGAALQRSNSWISS